MSENQTPNASESLPQEKAPETVMIATGDLYIPKWNPRQFKDELEMRKLVAYLQRGSRIEPITIWTPTETPQPGLIAVISGQRRLEAYRRLGRTHIPAVRMDVSLDDAKVLAMTANAGAEVHWLDTYESWEAYMADHPNWSQDRIATRLSQPPVWISRCYNLMQVLNADSRQLIRQQLAEVQQSLLKTEAEGSPKTAKKPKPWVLTEVVAFPLTGLLTKPLPEAQTLAAKALKPVLAQKLSSAKVEKLVEWLLAGNPPEDFDHKAANTKKGGSKTAPALVELIAKAAELSRQAALEEARGDAATTHRDAFKAFMETATAVNNPTPTPDTPPALQPISPSEGFAIFGQQIGKAAQWLASFFKPKESTLQPKPGASPTGHHAGSTEKEMAATIKWTEKIGKALAKIAWRGILKYEHHLVRKIANYIVPLKGFESAAGHTHSHHSKGISFSPQTAMAMLLHWFVYTLLQVTLLWVLFVAIPSHFFHALRPWAEWPFRFLAHEFFVVLINWAWPGMFHDWLIAVTVLAVVVGIVAAAKAQPQRMVFLGIILVLLWHYASAWRPPADEQALSVPISNKQEMGGRGYSDLNAMPSSPEVTGISSPAGTQQTSPTASAIGDSAVVVTQASAKPKAKHEMPLAVTSAPVMASDVAWTQEQLKVIPLNSLIKAYAFQPDFNMGTDMAYHRLSDLQVKEKYTVLYGTDQETITGITFGASNLSLTAKNGLPGFLESSTNMNVYWEDVKNIFCDVIKTTNGVKTKSTFMVFLDLKEAKKTLAIQCATGADLEHLVSALEFYIKLSGHNPAPIGSLPYLNQGLQMNDKNEVNLLWTDSPVGKTGLTFSDILWSMEKNTDKQQTKTELESSLQSLTTGSHNLYTVKPDEMKKALKESADNPDIFYPMRKKVTLTIP